MRQPARWHAATFAEPPASNHRQLLEFERCDGRDTDTLTPEALARVRRTVPGARTEELPGSHLFPLEHPKACARRILAFVDSLDAVSPPGRRAEQGRSPRS